MLPVSLKGKKIVGVHPRTGYLFKDKRFHEYYPTLKYFLLSFPDLCQSTDVLSQLLEQSQPIKIVLSDLIENYLIDLDLQNAVNPANFEEIRILRDTISSLVNLINSLSDPSTVILNYDPTCSRPDRNEPLLKGVLFQISIFQRRIDAILENRTKQGRPKKTVLKNLCINSVRLWELIRKEDFPISLRIHKKDAIDTPMHFVHRLVCLLQPNTTAAEVRHQLRTWAREKKASKSSG